MTRHKNAAEIAEILSEIYEQKFGGKSRGRFQISRSMFRTLVGRKVLRDAFIDEVASECLDLGYILFVIGDIIAIIEESVVIRYRSVTKSILNSYAGELDDTETTDEDDDEL